MSTGIIDALILMLIASFSSTPPAQKKGSIAINKAFLFNDAILQTQIQPQESPCYISRQETVLFRIQTSDKKQPSRFLRFQIPVIVQVAAGRNGESTFQNPHIGKQVLSYELKEGEYFTTKDHTYKEGAQISFMPNMGYWGGNHYGERNPFLSKTKTQRSEDGNQITIQSTLSFFYIIRIIEFDKNSHKEENGYVFSGHSSIPIKTTVFTATSTEEKDLF